MTPAEELTLAAERLEALDAAATPGPWLSDERGAEWFDIRTESLAIGMVYEDGGAAFIAAMRGVAEPLAAWLRDQCDSLYINDYALTLAREVIRATGGTP